MSYETAIPMVAMDIFIFSSLSSASAQASRVAPVVSTSSHSKICLHESAPSFTLKASSIFVTRSNLVLWVWLSVSRTLVNSSSEAGILRIVPIPSAISKLWLYPLFAFFDLCRGTGIMRSTEDAHSVFSRLSPSLRPR